MDLFQLAVQLAMQARNFSDNHEYQQQQSKSSMDHSEDARQISRAGSGRIMGVTGQSSDDKDPLQATQPPGGVGRHSFFKVSPPEDFNITRFNVTVDGVSYQK
jgi:hypothetical protein